MADQVRRLLLGRIPVRRGLHRRGHHGLGRDHHYHKARQPRALHDAAADRRAHDRRGSRAHRASLAQAVPQLHLHGQPRRRRRMRERHRHRPLGHSRARPSASRFTSCSADRCATKSRSTPTPTSASSPARRLWSAEIQDIVESGHTALKFDPSPHQGRAPTVVPREQRDGYLDGR